MTALKIPSGFLEQIRLQAEKEYPSECCGIITGPEKQPETLTRIVPCRNAQDELHRQDPETFPRTSRNAFFMDPAELLNLQKQCRESGEVVRVIYHSHPDSGAYFSEEDRKMAAPDGVPAWPGVFYLVVSTINGKADKAALFSWDSALKGFKGAGRDILF